MHEDLFVTVRDLTLFSNHQFKCSSDFNFEFTEIILHHLKVSIIVLAKLFPIIHKKQNTVTY